MRRLRLMRSWSRVGERERRRSSRRICPLTWVPLELFGGTERRDRYLVVVFSACHRAVGLGCGYGFFHLLFLCGGPVFGLDRVSRSDCGSVVRGGRRGDGSVSGGSGVLVRDDRCMGGCWGSGRVGEFC